MVLAISSALRAPAKGEACRNSVAFSSFGRHGGDDAINGIFFEESPPLPPKVGRGCPPTIHIPPQVPARQGKNRLGIFLKLLRDQFMLREFDLIERFVRHGLSSL
jgi:hypothetical protein